MSQREIMSKIIKFNFTPDATVSADPHCPERGIEREMADDDDLHTIEDEFEEERRWIDRVRANPENFWFFYDKYFDRVYGFLLKRTRDVHVAQDLTSATFTKALDKFWQYQWRGKPFIVWLLRIATNEANQYDKYKKRRPTDYLEDVDRTGERFADSGDTPDQQLDKAIEDEELIRAIESLDPKCRTWLTLHYMDGLSTPQVARVVGVKNGTMKARLSRCLDKLRDIME